MPARLRTIARKSLIAVNIITAILFVLSCLAPYVKPTQSWFISFLGLGFPFLFFILVLFILGWLIVKPRFAWFSFAALLFGYNSIRVTFAFNKPGSFTYEKKDSSHIRIASWNVARFLEWKKNNSEKSQTRLKMLEQIKKQNADIICLQEFFYSPDTNFYHNISEIQAMGYPYFYFSYDPDGWLQYIGSVIFSKYPMLDTGLVRYFRPSMPEALIHADIKVNNDTIRVFSTHLQSVQFRKAEYEALSKIKNAEDSMFASSKTVIAKLRKAMKYRSTQADVVRQILDDSPYPIVFCGDLNDIPNSFTHFTIRGDMQDAFLQKGSGIGRTYSSISPTLRIDYVFADDHFAIRQFTRVTKNLSDHYLLLTDVQIKR
jgi:endonuclease/exonuclease/phosphatase family metal-dependent hydrolase